MKFLQVLRENPVYFKSAPFYSVPFCDMWTKIVDSVKNNMLVSYKNEIHFGLWGNRFTKNIPGYSCTLRSIKFKQKMIDYFIDALSMNIVPIYCMSINDDLTFETKCFLKSGLTYFTSRPYKKSVFVS